MADLGDVGFSLPAQNPRAAVGYTMEWPGYGQSAAGAPPRPDAAFGRLQTGAALIEITTATPLLLFMEGILMDSAAPVGGVVRFYNYAHNYRYYARTVDFSQAWQIDVDHLGAVTVTPIVSGTYPTIPLGSRILILQGGKIKAITPA